MPIQYTCPHCGQSFTCWPATPRRYCSRVCEADAWETRFWPKVDKSGECWIWRGQIGVNGYGVFRKPGRSVGAHRVAWELANGPIPDGLSVLHHCDNPPCVRPDHLFLGTHLDNVADMVSKGRQGCRPTLGEAHHNAKLTAVDVRLIRSLYAEGMYKRVIAERFGLNESTVDRITRRVSWKHVV